MGGSHRQVRGHAFAGLVENRRWNPYPIVNAADDVGALLSQDPGHLWEPDISANKQTNSPDRGVKQREAQISRGKPQMCLKFAAKPAHSDF